MSCVIDVCLNGGGGGGYGGDGVDVIHAQLVTMNTTNSEPGDSTL